MTHHLQHICTTLICLFILSASVSAQTDASDSLSYAVDELVVTGNRLDMPTANTTAAKMPVPLHHTPASVGVVSAALIENRNATVLGEALTNVSGVSVHSGFGVHDLFVIRGFDSLDNGLVLTDGAAEPEVTFYHLYNIERVEVLKGPGAFLYGGSPLSGTVQLVRKQPLFADFVHQSASYGRYNTRRLTTDISQANADAGLAFRLNALLQSSDNHRDDKGNINIAINPAITWRLDQRSTLKLNFEYADAEYAADSGLPVIGNALAAVPRTRSYQSPFDASNQDLYRFRLDLDRRFGNKLELRNKFYYTDLSWPSKGTLFSGVFPNEQGSLDVIRTLLDLDDRQKLIGNQLEALFNLQTGAIQHQLLLGFELSRLEDDYTLDVAVLPTIDLFAPVETAVAPLFNIPGQSTAGDTRSIVLAPYFVDRLSFSSRLQLFAGGRFDAVDYEDKLTATKRDYQKFSPMLGLLLAPTPNLSLYANAGLAFAAPSARVIGPRRAEESTQFELGAKQRLLDGRLNLNVALFQLTKENIAIPDNSGITRQNGDQESRGLEIEIAARPAPDWHLFATYALLDAELTQFNEFVFVPSAEGFTPQLFERSGNVPAFAPDHLLTLWTARDLPYNFTLGVGARFVDSQFIAADNAFAIDSALTFDTSLTYRHGKTQWRLNLANLTSTKYETRGFGAASAIPAPPFTISATAAWTL